MSRHGQTTHVWHRLVSTLTAIAVAIGSAGFVSFMRAVPVQADTFGYPYYNEPCEHSPYTTTGVAHYCSNYDWGPTPDTTNGWTESNSLDPNYGNYGYRNCTDYVAWQLAQYGVPAADYTGLGNGGDWYTNAQTKGLVSVGTTPQKYAAAIVPGTTSNPAGHVAFVTSVTYNSDGTVNPNGNITVQEYNHDAAGNGDTWTGAPSTRGFTEYVYFAGVMANLPAGGTTGGGTPTTSRPVIVSRGSGSMDVFYRRSTDKALVNVGWSSTTGWGSAVGIGSNVGSNPAATSRTSDSMDVFYRDTNCWLWVVSWTAAAGWAAPVALITNGTVNADPTVIHRTSDSLDVFYKDSTGNLENVGWTASGGWSGPYKRVNNGTIDGSPVAITRSSGQMSVFYRDTSHDLMEEAWDSVNGWNGPWPHVTGSAAGDFSAVTRTSDSLDLAYATTGGGIAKIGWSATAGWSQQTLTASGTTGDPTVVARDSSDMDVFWSDSTGNLVDDGWSATNGWTGPYTRTNNVGDNPVGVARSSGDMDVFFRNDGADHVGDLTDAGWDVNLGWGLAYPGAGSMD